MHMAAMDPHIFDSLHILEEKNLDLKDMFVFLKIHLLHNLKCIIDFFFLKVYEAIMGFIYEGRATLDFWIIYNTFCCRVVASLQYSALHSPSLAWV